MENCRSVLEILPSKHPLGQLCGQSIRRVGCGFWKRDGFNPLEFSGHGFRAGGATDLFEAGVSLVAIMEFGRWKTAEACLRYYRKSAHLASRVARAFVSSDIGSGRMEHAHRKRGV